MYICIDNYITSFTITYNYIWYMNLPLYIYIYIHNMEHTYMHTCMHACIIHAYMHTCIHTACMHACIHAYMHTCIHTYIIIDIIYPWYRNFKLDQVSGPQRKAKLISKIFDVAWRRSDSSDRLTRLRILRYLRLNVCSLTSGKLA